MRQLFVLCAVAVAATAGTETARADVERYAVVIGNNVGAADEEALRFAEDDAGRVSELLGDVGGIRDENRILLRGKSADQVRRALIATNERIRIAQHTDRAAVLVVYYSGHGDADALHLADSRLEFRELEALVRGSPAQVRVMVIDACRSGALTRVKGGRSAPPLALSRTDEMSGEGIIVLTASSAGEDAQESDQIGGSFFTHYLLSGLRGAADDNSDQVISVGEAFGYTREQTILASSRTLGGTQHPTFHFDLRGRSDVVLADLGNHAERGQLTLPEGATWLILRGNGGGMIAEVAVTARRRTLSLPAGRYVVRGRSSEGLIEGGVVVVAQTVTVVDPNKLDRTGYPRRTNKGAPERIATSVFAGPYSMAPSVSGEFACFGGMAGWTYVRDEFSLSPRIGGCATPNAELPDRSIIGLIAGDVRAARIWRFEQLSASAGFTVGVERLYESQHDPVTGAERRARRIMGAHVDVTGAITLPLGAPLYLDIEGAIQSHFYENENSNGLTRQRIHPVLRAVFSVGLWL